jgi:phage-related holin
MTIHWTIDLLIFLAIAWFLAGIVNNQIIKYLNRRKIKKIASKLTTYEIIEELERRVNEHNDKNLPKDFKAKIYPFLIAFKQVEHLASYNTESWTDKKKKDALEDWVKNIKTK